MLLELPWEPAALGACAVLCVFYLPRMAWCGAFPLHAACQGAGGADFTIEAFRLEYLQAVLWLLVPAALALTFLLLRREQPKAASVRA